MSNQRSRSTVATGRRVPIFVTDPDACRRVLETLSLISSEVRLKILCLLRDGERCVTDLAEAAGGKRSNVSQQLKLLTLAGWLERSRVEQRVVYRLADKRVRALLDFLHGQFGSI